MKKKLLSVWMVGMLFAMTACGAEKKTDSVFDSNTQKEGGTQEQQS